MVLRMASTAASAGAVVHASSWAIAWTISAFLIMRRSVRLAHETCVAPAVDTMNAAGAPRLAGELYISAPTGGKLIIGRAALSSGFPLGSPATSVRAGRGTRRLPQRKATAAPAHPTHEAHQPQGAGGVWGLQGGGPNRSAPRSAHGAQRVFS